MQQARFALVPVHDLIPRESQVRRYFDPSAHKDLVASIRAQGQVQAILARPLGEKLQIVAGERRWRAIAEIFGPRGLVKAEIRHMTDDEVEAASIVENSERLANSITEQSDAAARILALVDGDRAEAAKRLGWSPEKLANRLAFQHCSREVKDALNQRKINVGHAELLAAIPMAKQPAFLSKILGLNISVESTRAFLAQAAQDLSTAPFDKAECVRCPHNSSQQVSLGFEAHIGDGHCLNATCYASKVDAHIENVRAALADELPNVRVVESGDLRKIIPLIVEGPQGVGREQFESGCRGCANYGATISKVPRSFAEVQRDQCFDPNCNQRLVAKRIQSNQPAAGQPEKPNGAANPPPTTPRKVEVGAIGQRVKEYRVGAWRGAAVHAMTKDANMAVTTLLSFALCDQARVVRTDAIRDRLGKVAAEMKYPKSFGESLGALNERDKMEKSRLLVTVAQAMVVGCGESELEKLLAFYRVSLSETWRINPDLLSLMTKSEIEVLAKEVGLKKALGERFQKLLAGKKDDLIKALVAVKDFDYTTAIPSCMKYRGYGK